MKKERVVKTKHLPEEYTQGMQRKVMFFAALFVLFICVFCRSKDSVAESNPKENLQQTESLESEGLTYEYISLQPDEATSNKYDIDGSIGKIRISETLNRKNIIYLEEFALKPGCDKCATISRLPMGKEWLVALCGSTGGRHQSIKIFKRGYILLDFRTATLDFENTNPNIADINNDGFYEAIVYRRVMFSDGEYSSSEYLMVYKLNVDSTLFGFVPVFGKNVLQTYFDYYVKKKKSFQQALKPTKVGTGKKNMIKAKEDIGSMLAALLSTKDNERICSEISSLERFGLTLADIKKMTQRLTSIGYPDFDFKICEEVSK